MRNLADSVAPFSTATKSGLNEEKKGGGNIKNEMQTQSPNSDEKRAERVGKTEKIPYEMRWL